MKSLIFFLFFLILIIPLFVFAYLGLVPGLSHLLGADKPTDLGITYTQLDLFQAELATQIDRAVLPPGSSKEFDFSTKTHHVNQTLTSPQVTAWINQRTWKHYPFSNLQIKFGQDGQAQVSGNVDIKKLITYFQVIEGSSPNDSTKVSSYIPLSGNPAFYLDFTGDIENNQVDLTLNQVKIGNLSIPRGLVSSYTLRLLQFIEKNTLSHPSVNFRELRPINGQLKVVGTLPDIESVKQ